MLDDYIKRSNAIRALDCLVWSNSADHTRRNILENVMCLLPPADVVEVVRCKDCKYGVVDNADFPNQYFCNHHGFDWNEGNHYCSYGERAES